MEKIEENGNGSVSDAFQSGEKGEGKRARRTSTAQSNTPRRPVRKCSFPTALHDYEVDLDVVTALKKIGGEDTSVARSAEQSDVALNPPPSTRKRSLIYDVSAARPLSPAASSSSSTGATRGRTTKRAKSDNHHIPLPSPPLCFTPRLQPNIFFIPPPNPNLQHICPQWVEPDPALLEQRKWERMDERDRGITPPMGPMNVYIPSSLLNENNDQQSALSDSGPGRTEGCKTVTDVLDRWKPHLPPRRNVPGFSTSYGDEAMALFYGRNRNNDSHLKYTFFTESTPAMWMRLVGRGYADILEEVMKRDPFWGLPEPIVSWPDA